VRANDKHPARLNLIRHVLVKPAVWWEGGDGLLAFDASSVFPLHQSRLEDGSMAKWDPTLTSGCCSNPPRGNAAAESQ
jgi:hypothetical protein